MRATSTGGLEEYRSVRMFRARLRKEVALGFSVGVLLLACGAWNCFLVIEADSVLWGALMWTGGALLVLTTLLPSVWRKPVQWLHKMGACIGHVCLTLSLTLIYLICITPLGALLRLWRGRGPFVQWRDGPPSATPDWETVVMNEAAGVSRQRRFIIWQMIGALSFLLRHGSVLIFPSAVLVLLLGLLFWFISTSALAPLIYTLF